MPCRIAWSAIAVTVAAILASTAGADPAQDAKKSEAPKQAPEKLGVLLKNPHALPGYNLINPRGKKTYLFDNEGRVVHTWTSKYASGAAVYLDDNGHLFRPADAPKRKTWFVGPAASGRFQEFDWDGNLVWDFEYHSDKRMPHHDAIKLPNGNALLICWEKIEDKEAIARGRRPETVQGSHLQPDCLVEIKPTGKTTGEVVWEWRSWDHLIQDSDPNKPNYGKISEHPERFDLNFPHLEEAAAPKQPAGTDGRDKKADAKKGQAKDAPKKERGPRKEPDWMHVNAVAYNAELNQIALSSPRFCEIWIIDHGTTTEEARGHTGGRWGKGGDILYRWGNPRAYRNGSKADQRLFGQHNIQWIPRGVPGEGHMLVFNNGGGRNYSSVDEFVPSTDSDGNYTRGRHAPFGPSEALWSYSASTKKDFFSWFISGAQRMSNGNTLINAGAIGIVFEVTPAKEVVWRFANPMKNVGGGPPPRPGQRRPGNTLFRATRYALDHPAFQGRTFEPGKTLVEIQQELDKAQQTEKAGSAKAKPAAASGRKKDDSSRKR